MPDREEVTAWLGYRVDDVYGGRVGRLEDAYLDAETGRPEWIVARFGRFTEEFGLIPVTDCVAGAGHVWTPFERDAIRRSPRLATSEGPLRRLQEEYLNFHYGVVSERLELLAERPAAAITAVSLRVTSGCARQGRRVI